MAIVKMVKGVRNGRVTIDDLQAEPQLRLLKLSIHLIAPCAYFIYRERLQPIVWGYVLHTLASIRVLYFRRLLASWIRSPDWRTLNHAFTAKMRLTVPVVITTCAP
jgi:hypothetical protein